MLGTGTSRNQTRPCFRKGTWKGCGWWLLGRRLVGAANDTALGSPNAGRRKPGLNPVLPLDSCVTWDKALSLTGPQFPLLSKEGWWGSVSGMWGVGLTVTRPTPPAGQRHPFAVTLGPEGEVHLRHHLLLLDTF